MPLPLLHYLYGSGLSKYQHQQPNGDSSWALITGASDGIGRELCTQLAFKGFNVVLHGRNEAKLVKCREELEATFPKRHFRTVAADASAFTQDDIDRILKTVSDVPLTILVNNVGGTAPLSSNFKHFEDTTVREIDAVFSLNIKFPIRLTLALLPQLQAQKKPTLVVNCGSQSQVGQAYVAAYSATKGALHTWSRSLAIEQYEEKTQVDVTEVVIGATYTQQLVKDPNMKPGLMMPRAEAMAKAIIARLGNGHRSVYAWFWHNVQTWALYSLLPEATADSIVAGVLIPSVEARGK